MRPYLLSCFLVLCLSCTKQDQKSTFTGYIYNASDSTPYANTSFVFHQEVNAGLLQKAKHISTSFTTNAFGYFSVSTALQPGVDWLYISWPDNDDYETAIKQINVSESNRNLDTIYTYR